MRSASHLAFAGVKPSPREPRHVLRVRLRGGVALPGQRIELRLGEARTGEEAGVPEVVRLEQPPSRSPDQRRHLRDQRRVDDRLQQGRQRASGIS